MPNNDTGSILIHLVDGTRQPFPNVSWSGTIRDGRAPSQSGLAKPFDGAGSIELLKDLTYFDNPIFDAYTLTLNAKKYEDTSLYPIHLSPQRPASVNLMMIPKNGRLDFSGADWQTLARLRPRFSEILGIGVKNPAARYNNLTNQNAPVAACILNLLTAMSQIMLPSGKSPLDYYWEPIWSSKEFPMAQDRFYAYVDKAIVDDVIKANKMGSFSEEKNPGTWHAGATRSYKQTQFDVTNVQLTFHEGNTSTLDDGAGNKVDCIVIEPDIDYYKDLLAHALLEVLPNSLQKGHLTDPRGAYLLRWVASKQAGLDFNPLYTITA